MFFLGQLSDINKSVPIEISFPYQYKIIKNGKLADPVIYLTIITQLGTRRVGFLVDSGSDTTILPLIPYMFWFNFTPNPHEETTLGEVEGKGVAAYPGKITLRIDKEDISVRCYFVKSNTIPLLGRLDLWDRFKRI